MLVEITNRYFKTASNHMIIKVTKFFYSVQMKAIKHRFFKKCFEFLILTRYTVLCNRCPWRYCCLVVITAKMSKH